jgi:hypothetical protein
MNKFAPGNLALPVARWFFKKYTDFKITGGDYPSSFYS